LKVALRCGVKVEEYNELTPHVLMLILDAHNEELQRKRDDLLTQAWLTANWQRAGRLPPLRQVLEQSRPRRMQPQSDDQMLAVVKRLQASFEREEG